ncbi:hypothetical protein BJ875DRAFT_514166 [Amylocarpus encephaloides]|uniref:Uncharacterized protein n=1 Tax=Amylocarpus encephaloides TaxID=45428 RepID=A0A9P7YFV3_9HELO|nr:hypothetical protein BJ875DRAFT_514166 [Amylocarpus encephaloides]
MSSYNRPTAWQEAYAAQYDRSATTTTGNSPAAPPGAFNYRNSSHQQYGSNVAASSSLTHRSNQQSTFIQPAGQEAVLPHRHLKNGFEQEFGVDNIAAPPPDFSQMPMAARQAVYNTLPLHEQKKQEAWAQLQLKSVGVCAIGWIFKRGAHGYRCFTGIGNHYVSDQLLTEGRGGYYQQEIDYFNDDFVVGEEFWSGPWYKQGRNMVRRTPRGIVAGNYIPGQELGIVPLSGTDVDILRYAQMYDLREREVQKLRDEAKKGRGMFGGR